MPLRGGHRDSQSSPAVRASTHASRPTETSAGRGTGAHPIDAASPDERPRPAAPDRESQSEIAQKAQAGLIPFLIASAIGGLFALVMPCVWPMVPITVNFFVKQGQGSSGRKKTTGLAFTYCLSIIAVFTAVGVLFSFFFSASSLQTPGQQSLAEPVRGRPFPGLRPQPAGPLRAELAQLPLERLVS